jgi:NADPH:quinone reductase-like Zn-dependent oxidoreductase
MTDEPTRTRRDMRAVRLHAPGGIERLSLDRVPLPSTGEGEALVRVVAAAITRDELAWPVDRLPAIPSYELFGVVEAVGPDTNGLLRPGDTVYGLTPFDRDGVAAEYAVVPVNVLGAAPHSLEPAENAALPMPGLSAWQALFVHGQLRPGQRVLIHGAAGGVGHIAVQLAAEFGAHVVGTGSPTSVEAARRFGAREVVDWTNAGWAETIEPVDLVFDTVGGQALAGSPAVLREGGRIVTVADEPPEGVEAVYFVVEPNREQLVEMARLADAGHLRPAIDAVFPLADARAAFERTMASGKRGKIVLEVSAR